MEFLILLASIYGQFCQTLAMAYQALLNALPARGHMQVEHETIYLHIPYGGGRDPRFNFEVERRSETPDLQPSDSETDTASEGGSSRPSSPGPQLRHVRPRIHDQRVPSISMSSVGQYWTYDQSCRCYNEAALQNRPPCISLYIERKTPLQR